MMGFIRGQSGESILGGMYTMFLIALVLFVAVEVSGYSTSVWKLYGAAGEIMELMKAQNGFDGEMQYRFRELQTALGLDDLVVQIDGTGKSKQRGELLELRINGVYPIHSLRPFGREFTVPIHLRLHGLAHMYIRDR